MGIGFKNDTITVHRPAWVSERGDRVADWEHATTHTVGNCLVQPRAAGEVTQGGSANTRRDGGEATWWVSAPVDADIEQTDRITHPKIRLPSRGPSEPPGARIVGHIRVISSPTGALDHLEIALSDTEG